MQKTDNTPDNGQKDVQGLREIDRRILALLKQRRDRVAAGQSGPPEAAVDKGQCPHPGSAESLSWLDTIDTQGLDKSRLVRVFAEIQGLCRQERQALKVSYLGPEATFTHMAAKNYFDETDVLIPQAGIRDVFEEVAKGNSDFGVVPVENSIEGSVNHTLDLFPESDLNICAETYLVISHDLLSPRGDLSDIQMVYSHPQSFAQCRGWLKKNLPQAELVECSSTAQAAQKALETPRAAAIAGSEAARLYHLSVVAPRIQDFSRNTTRFLIIGRREVPPTGQDKTSLMFVTSHVPGALFQVLAPIAEARLNMLKLESRPAKYENWSYLFFVDLEGHKTEAVVQDTLQKMASDCQYLKVLGSYPVFDRSAIHGD